MQGVQLFRIVLQICLKYDKNVAVIVNLHNTTSLWTKIA